MAFMHRYSWEDDRRGSLPIASVQPFRHALTPADAQSISSASRFGCHFASWLGDRSSLLDCGKEGYRSKHRIRRSSSRTPWWPTPACGSAWWPPASGSVPRCSASPSLPNSFLPDGMFRRRLSSPVGYPEWEILRLLRTVATRCAFLSPHRINRGSGGRQARLEREHRRQRQGWVRKV